MQKRVFVLLSFLLLTLIFISQVPLSHHLATDNDEGIYLTSFLLINKGSPPYTQTFFSQPPGFILVLYPFFLIFGKSLIITRLIIGLWSIAGLAVLLWLGWQLRYKVLGFIAIGLLYLVPHYFNQTLVFQSDALVTTFSLLTLGFFLKFIKTSGIRWFVLSGFFVNLAFWTKFEVTLLPALLTGIIIYAKNQRRFPKNFWSTLLYLAGISGFISLAFFLILVAPFGVKGVFNDTILYRFQASSYTLGSTSLLTLLRGDNVLFLIVILGILFTVVNLKKMNLEAVVLSIWGFTSLLFFFLYKPLFPHHLAILSVPIVLLVSYWVSKMLYGYSTKFTVLLTIIILVLAFGQRLILIKQTQLQEPLDTQRQKAVNYIINNTRPDDLVVSDEEILNALSERLPPPELSDLSYVRFYSQNLTSREFKQIIDKTKPKIIISWSGRLQGLKGFFDFLIGYKRVSGNLDNSGRQVYLKE